ncbi:hypothetical protein LJR130_006112 [Variovorax sp. LjRoot130]|uniref:hypothetical protein n=1 Tax=Variovorax sp. LjRoot130 TaxID=3342261 RepID=UPI003ECF2CC6
MSMNIWAKFESSPPRMTMASGRGLAPSWERPLEVNAFQPLSPGLCTGRDLQAHALEIGFGVQQAGMRELSRLRGRGRVRGRLGRSDFGGRGRRSRRILLRGPERAGAAKAAASTVSAGRGSQGREAHCAHAEKAAIHRDGVVVVP